MAKTQGGPRWAEALIRWMADDNDVAEILGDFHETYLQRRSDKGNLNATIWYWRQTFRLAVTLVPRRFRSAPPKRASLTVSPFLSPSLRTIGEN